MSMLVSAATAALMVFGGGLAACGDSGGSSSDVTGDTTFVPNDTSGTNNTDTTTPTDTVGGTDTNTGTDTNPGDTNTTTDTETGDTGGTTIPRQCTDAELDTLNTCLEGCPDIGGETCAQGCFNGLSTGCNAAYTAFIQCIQANSCFNEDNTLNAECAAEKCPDEVAGVFGGGVEPTDCDPVTNDGCTAEQNCTVIDEANNLGCAPKGEVATGGDCNQALCETGMCLSSDGVNGTCHQFCDPQNNTCPDSRPCNIQLQGTDFIFCGDIPTDCDVLAQDCESPKGCYFVDQQGNTDCALNNNKGAGESCTYLNDCAPGFMCAGNPGTCMAFCATDGSVACTSGTCTALGIDVYGVCVTQ